MNESSPFNIKNKQYSYDQSIEDDSFLLQLMQSNQPDTENNQQLQHSNNFNSKKYPQSMQIFPLNHNNQLLKKKIYQQSILNDQKVKQIYQKKQTEISGQIGQKLANHQFKPVNKNKTDKKIITFTKRQNQTNLQFEYYDHIDFQQDKVVNGNDLPKSNKSQEKEKVATQKQKLQQNQDLKNKQQQSNQKKQQQEQIRKAKQQQVKRIKQQQIKKIKQEQTKRRKQKKLQEQKQKLQKLQKLKQENQKFLQVKKQKDKKIKLFKNQLDNLKVFKQKELIKSQQKIRLLEIEQNRKNDKKFYQAIKQQKQSFQQELLRRENELRKKQEEQLQKIRKQKSKQPALSLQEIKRNQQQLRKINQIKSFLQRRNSYQERLRNLELQLMKEKPKPIKQKSIMQIKSQQRRLQVKSLSAAEIYKMGQQFMQQAHLLISPQLIQKSKISMNQFANQMRKSSKTQYKDYLKESKLKSGQFSQSTGKLGINSQIRELRNLLLREQDEVNKLIKAKLLSVKTDKKIEKNESPRLKADSIALKLKIIEEFS